MCRMHSKVGVFYQVGGFVRTEIEVCDVEIVCLWMDGRWEEGGLRFGKVVRTLNGRRSRDGGSGSNRSFRGLNSRRRRWR